MRHLGWLVVLVIAGCGADPAGTVGGGDVAGQDTARGSLEFQGRVSMGTPVAGATVRALINAEDGSWVEVSTGLTDAAGVFEVMVPGDRVHRPLRLIAEGPAAQYTEAADGATATLGASGRLMVDLESAATREGTVVQLSAWTTLAGCAADAYAKGHQVDGVIGWTEAMLLARRRVRDHLAGAQELDLAAAAPSDLSMGPWPYPNPSTTLGLAATGLSALVRFGEEPGTSAALVGLLCRDLSDGLFDGLESVDGGPEPLTAPPGYPHLDPDTTRYALAAATHAFLGTPRDASGLATEELAVTGGYYETISFDDGPLYPPAPAPTRFDPLPPALAFTTDSPPEDAPVGGPFTLTVTGDDPWGTVLVRFEETEPGGLLAPDAAGTPDVRALEVIPEELGIQGSLRFIFSGTDPQGNTAEISRRLLVDTVEPTATVVAPDPETCHETWTTPVVLAVTDEGSGVFAVEAEDGSPCALSKGDEWACPPPAQGAESATYLAADAAGNITAVTVWFCPDLEAPLVTFGAPAGLGFWGPDFPTITVTLSDPAGVSDWTVKDGADVIVPLAADAATPNSVLLTLALPDEGDALAWSVEATDGHGNQGTTALALVHDTVPPEYATTTPEIPLGSAWKVSFRVGVTDALSGVSSVTVLSDGAWTVTPEEAGVVHVEGIPELPPAGPGVMIPVELEATDLVGNVSTHGIGVLHDDAPPIITWHTTGFVDETDCTVAPGIDGPLYSCAGAAVLLGPEACAPDCPPIRKLASRLSYQDPGDIATQNLPSLHLEIHDLLPGEMVDPGGQYPVTLSWSFTRDGAALAGGEALLSDLLGHDLQIPFSSEHLFGLPAGEATFAPDTYPDTVEIVASDAAGNPVTMEIPLDLDVLPPLLHVTTVGGAADGAPPSVLAAAFLAGEPADIAGVEDVEAVRLTLTNLSELPVAMELGDPPEHRLQYAVGSAYLRGNPAAGLCAPGACLYATGPPDPPSWDPTSCQGPMVLDWALLPEATAGLSMVLDDIDGALEWTGDDVILPGGAAVDVVLTVSLAEIPKVTPTEETPVWAGGDFEEHAVHFIVDATEEWAFCGVTLQFAAAFEVSPALRLLRSRTPLDTSALLVARKNPQGATIMADMLDVGWDRVHEATWPHVALPPDVSAGW
jgi:hypothetical protein